MIQYPRFKAKYHVETVADEGIYLISENERHVLEGGTMFAIAPLLDGTRSWADITAQLSSILGVEEINAGIDVLIRNGHVEEAIPAPWDAFQIFWSELGLSAADARARCAAANIHVIGFGHAETAPVFAGLQAFGIASDPNRPAGMAIAVTDDYQNTGLAALNQRMLALKLPWLLLKPQGLAPMVGPVFRPHQGACLACLDHWLSHNREVEGYLRRRGGHPGPLPLPRARVPLGETQAVSLALLQVVRWIARSDSPTLDGRILVLDTLSGEQYGHPVNRRPQCAACGEPSLAQRAGRPVALANPLAAVANENGVRAEEPETTYKRYAHLISPLTGVVKGIFPSAFTGWGPIQTYVAGHNFALKNDSLYFLKDGLRSNSSGKGRSPAQARTSALCEALERYSGVFRHEEEIRMASMTDLGADAVDPREVMLYSDAQYADRDSWNARAGRFQIVPEPFDAAAEAAWTPVWSWSGRQRKWMLASQLYYGFSEPMGRFWAWADSNGCAAGGTFEDALLQGGLEIVERDAVGLWWMNRASRPAVDLAAFADPWIDGLVQFFAGLGREVWALDLTADLGIPVVTAINRRRNGPTEDIIMGFGAHFDARIALSRALTEMLQFSPAVLDVSDDGPARYAFDDPAAVAWWQTATVANQPYLRPSEARASAPNDFPEPPDGPVRDLVLNLFGRFEGAGHEVLIHDQTRPDIGLPVAKVIVPGMRHFWARYAPGRLYDVPVKLGWREAPCAEADLNPIAMFI